jgi:hypothetical protein
MRVLAFLLLIPLLAGCGGWHGLYQDPANPSGNASYSATIGNGTVSPPSGTTTQGTLVTFTASPSIGFECVTYTVNGGTPVNCAPANPSPNGGDVVTVAIPISQTAETIAFQTVSSSGGGSPTGMTDSFTATIDQGSVTPSSGSAADGTSVTFTASPGTGFEASTYTINGSSPIDCAPLNPSPSGGDPVSVQITLTANPTTVAFQTTTAGTTQAVRLPTSNN